MILRISEFGNIMLKISWLHIMVIPGEIARYEDDGKKFTDLQRNYI